MTNRRLIVTTTVDVSQALAAVADVLDALDALDAAAADVLADDPTGATLPPTVQ